MSDITIVESEGTLIIDAVSVGGGSGLPAVTGNDGYALIEVGSVPAFRPIKAGYVVPVFDILTFALSGASLLEVGDTATTPAFTATYNRTPDSAILTDNDGNGPINVTGTPTAFSSSFNFSKTANNASVLFTLSADEDGDPDVVNDTLNFQPRTFYGVDFDGLSTEADIEGLATSQLDSNRNISFTVNPGAGEHIYYSYPTSYGTATFTVNGFAGGFTLVSSAISVTNPFAVAQNYSLYKSINANLGSTLVSVT